MFKRIVFSACLAGLLAGLFLTLIQTVQVVPLILETEAYEISEAATAPVHEGVTADHHHHDGEWAPADGWQRTGFTAIANVLIAMGFALLLGAAFILRQGIDWPQGLLWGLAGYTVFFILPSLGLPPEIPGTFAANLVDRQAWWLLTVSCSALGLALLLLQRQWRWKLTGALLLIVPHLIGAPHPEVAGGSAPQALAQAFLWATAIVNGLFWLLLGGLTAFMFKRLA